MSFLFSWLQKPNNPTVDGRSWTDFLNSWSATFVILVSVMIGLLVLLYYLSASRRKIVTPDDLFRPYTPLRWLWASLLGGVAAAALAVFDYQSQFRGYDGVLPLALISFGEAAVLCALIAYLLIVAVKALTPEKYWPRRSGFAS